MLRSLRRDLDPQPFGQAPESFAIRVAVVDPPLRAVEHGEERTNRLGADLGLEPFVALVPRFHTEIVVLVLIEQVEELQVLLTRMGHHVGRVIDDLLQIPERHPHQVSQLAGERLEEPDMADRHGQLDVTHSLAAHFGQSDLDAATVADMPAETDPLELPAVALPVLDRAEDAFTEQTVPLRFEGTVVDGLGLRHLAERPRTDLFRRGDLDLDVIEVRGVLISRSREINHRSIPPGRA